MVQVRHDVQCKPSTAVKFMTDGILLRELQSDFLLSAYSCLVIDEAHERSLSTDLLLGAARESGVYQDRVMTHCDLQGCCSDAYAHADSPQAFC